MKRIDPNRLTERQAQVLQAILRHIRDFGFPPTYRELANAIGIRSLHGARDHIYALEARGVIQVTKGEPRGRRVIEPRASQLLAEAAGQKPPGRSRRAEALLGTRLDQPLADPPPRPAPTATIPRDSGTAQDVTVDAVTVVAHDGVTEGLP